MQRVECHGGQSGIIGTRLCGVKLEAGMAWGVVSGGDGGRGDAGHRPTLVLVVQYVVAETERDGQGVRAALTVLTWSQEEEEGKDEH
eukprot:7441244-Ditylum_brightwellii.AAC.1